MFAKIHLPGFTVSVICLGSLCAAKNIYIYFFPSDNLYLAVNIPNDTCSMLDIFFPSHSSRFLLSHPLFGYCTIFISIT